MSSNPNISPVNTLPTVVILLVLALVGVELALSLGQTGYMSDQMASGWRANAVADYAFYGVIVDDYLSRGLWDANRLMRFFTYSFVHWSFTHALFVVVFALALGKFVGEVFRAWAVLVVFLGSGVVGAAVYGLVLDDPLPLVGGFPAVYGLIGAFTFLLWVRLGAVGANRNRAFSLIGMLLGIQLVFGLLFGTDNTWVAELSGFTTGFALSFVVSPGGWARVRAKLRHQ